MGRVKTFESIVKGQNVPPAGIPESFKVLIKELQSLGLDIKVLDKNNEEIDLKQNFDDEDAGLIPADEAVEFEGENVALEDEFEGFEIGDMNEESDEFADFAGFGYSEEDI